MSILIKGIDMPKDREFVLLKVFSDGKTRIGLSTNYTEAIQIPKGHGAIKDGDALIRQLQDAFCDNCVEHKKYGGVMCSTCHIDDVILEYGDAPTILEAEE